MKHVRARWISGALRLNMYSALGAGVLRLMRWQRALRNFGNKESQNWEYEETYIIEFENKNHRVVEL